MDSVAVEKAPCLSEYDLEIPEHLIAQYPAEQRDHCRLMVVDRADETISDLHFYDLPELLDEGDVLVMNDTQVLPARLFASKNGAAGQIEVLLLREIDEDHWEALVKPGRKVRPGDRLTFSESVTGDIIEHTPAGGRVIRFEHPGCSFDNFLNEHGQPPLPPYIHRDPLPEDTNAYQTVYARHRGAVAAPTAGLHFTTALLEQLRAKGVKLAFLTLHVGLGTFRPVQEEDVTRHRMEAEYYSVSEETARVVNQAAAEGRRVVAAGTSTTRTLETVTAADRSIASGEGWTDLFIYPPYEFKAVDVLLTNFHQPRSTLIMMVSAFAGKQLIFQAYERAIKKDYRFYSYGDAMLIL